MISLRPAGSFWLKVITKRYQVLLKLKKSQYPKLINLKLNFKGSIRLEADYYCLMRKLIL